MTQIILIFWFVGVVGGNWQQIVVWGRRLRNWHRRRMRRRIERMIDRYRWHNNVLDTNIPNVACLKVKNLVVINSYGQEHVIR